MRCALLFILAITLISFSQAECSSGQIDINSASLEDLMKIKWLGGKGTVAQKVIDARPFNSLEDLSKVSGLGGSGSRLTDIKEQGLACIGSGDFTKEESSYNEELELEKVSGPEKRSERINSKVIEETLQEQSISLESEQTESIINLNSDAKTIKEKVVYESRSEQIRKYSIYVFIIFLLIVAVFLLFDKHERAKDYSTDDY